MLSSTFAKLLHVIQQFCYYYLNLIDEEAIGKYYKPVPYKTIQSRWLIHRRPNNLPLLLRKVILLCWLPIYK